MVEGCEHNRVIGVIGGSGIDAIEGLVETRWERVTTPFGDPSDRLLLGELAGVPLAFLPRHGRGHRLPPHAINYRANIDALKRVGVTDILSLSAVGSLTEEQPPGSFLLVDQFIDRTTIRDKSFFEGGLVAHVSMAYPVCGSVAAALWETGQDLGIPIAQGGTYLVMEGPQFSSLAESKFYRQLGCDVVGMTNMPEAKLAREAEICYATVAMVTDYDCWHPDHDHVQVEDVIQHLQANAGRARALVQAVVPRLAQRPQPCANGCDRALDTALITAPEARDPTVLRHLDAVAGRVLGGSSSQAQSGE